MNAFIYVCLISSGNWVILHTDAFNKLCLFLHKLELYDSLRLISYEELIAQIYFEIIGSKNDSRLFMCESYLRMASVIFLATVLEK
jgi:hypothetical protein